jgi:23S rRNA G2069 N7-methylase RlmK/C1962 C5-methylase RlmI
MFYFDRHDPRVVFGDCRRETITVADHSCGNASGQRTLAIDPDVLLDFRVLPYPDESFALVVFDPPHLIQAGPKSWLAAKYGKLGKDWREDLRAGFRECFRVLRPNGTLIFKWCEYQIPLHDVLALTPERPVFGNRRPKSGTHWLVFFKGRAA